MIYSIGFSSSVPLIFLFLIYRLDFFRTEKFGLILIALVWGAIAVALTYYVCHPLVPILGRPLVSMRINPFVEEVFKSLILLYLLSRADYLYFVSGAIYGFAAGIGFAVAENTLYLSRLDVDTGLIVALTRAFSCVMHGGSTALVGLAVGGLPLMRRMPPVLAWLCGLAAATAYHMGYNYLAFQNLGQMALPVLIGAAFCGPLLVAALILWGLGRERADLHEALGLNVAVSEEEAVLVQHMDDLDRLLKPIERRFGKDVRNRVVELLRAEADIGLIKRKLVQKLDPAVRSQLESELARLEKENDRRRLHLGLYVMLYVRSIFPKMTWSLWARLAHLLASAPSGRSPVWSGLRARLGAQRVPGQDLYARVAAKLQGTHPQSKSAHHLKELPDAMQKCLHWIMREVHVTAEHVAATLGQREAQATELLAELVDRGFLHRFSHKGQVAYRSSLAPGKITGIWGNAAKRASP